MKTRLIGKTFIATILRPKHEKKEIIVKLQDDLFILQGGMWQLSEDAACQHHKNLCLQEIIDRQDELIMWLWGLIETAEKEGGP